MLVAITKSWNCLVHLWQKSKGRTPRAALTLWLIRLVIQLPISASAGVLHGYSPEAYTGTDSGFQRARTRRPCEVQSVSSQVPKHAQLKLFECSKRGVCLRENAKMLK